MLMYYSSDPSQPESPIEWELFGYGNGMEDLAWWMENWREEGLSDDGEDLLVRTIVRMQAALLTLGAGSNPQRMWVR